MLGSRPERPSGAWLVLGALLGVAVQVGPGALAGVLDWSPWWAVAWGTAVGFYAAVLKSSTGRAILSGTSLPPHWLAGVAIAFPLTAAAFSALNLVAFWCVSWLLR